MSKYVIGVVSPESSSDNHKPMSKMGFKEVCIIVQACPEFNECIGEVVMRVTPFDRVVVLSLSSNMIWNGESEMTDIIVRPYNGDELLLKLR
jgi:tRNA (Thr-GGU) A37 N-methylase